MACRVNGVAVGGADTDAKGVGAAPVTGVRRPSLLDGWSRFLKQEAEKRRPGTTKELNEFFAWMPEHLRMGPWAWAPTVVLTLFMAGLVFACPAAMESYRPMPEAKEVWNYRAVGMIYGLAVASWVVAKDGPWPLASWTILGWVCATTRYTAGVLGFAHLQRVLTFPALMSNTVTLVVWYTVLVPGIAISAESGKKFKAVKDWVLPPLLITVHGINFPFCVYDWYLQPFRLEFFDLWVGGVYCAVYILFYLLVLDQLGLFFYFILSPRAWWGAGVYAGIVAFTYAIFLAFNAYAPVPL